MNTPLFLALPDGNNYGWGVCGHYLRQELGRLTEVVHLADSQEVAGSFFTALNGASLQQWFTAKGNPSIGYVFFEDELTEESLKNAQQSDLILAGSTWCVERLKAKGISHVGLLLQGIDHEMFYPVEEELDTPSFNIFSGGKFELRKGQDLVLKAFAALQYKYPDMRLITCWQNQWVSSLATMQASSHIRFALHGQTWAENLHMLCNMNGIDPARVQVCPLIPQHKMRALMKRTHLGVFPNRCEGGTNLVLMEYMACGRPAVVSYTSGHRDVVTEENALLLKQLTPFELKNQETVVSRWEEASVDELIAAIEYAYHHRDALKTISKKAGEDMAVFTWEQMAKNILNFIK